MATGRQGKNSPQAGVGDFPVSKLGSYPMESKADVWFNDSWGQVSSEYQGRGSPPRAVVFGPMFCLACSHSITLATVF
jgi:hypothetical protein